MQIAPALAQLGTKVFVLLGCTVSIFDSTNPAFAQIIPDNTLGAEASQVIESDFDRLQRRIEGGAQRGRNLFHSFRELNVAADEQLFFRPADDVQTVFTRVTGNQQSTIEGTLGVEGDADLFLLNPNGIEFGQRALLDVQGSFVGTTADSIQFGDRGDFTALTPSPPSSLLTIQPSALIFSPIHQSPQTAARSKFGLIRNTSRPRIDDDFFGLAVPTGEALLLVGREVLIDGGGLFANAGRIGLSGIATAGSITIETKDWSLTPPVHEELAPVEVLNQGTIAMGEGGIIRIQGSSIRIKNRLNPDYSPIVLYSGETPGKIEISAQHTVEVVGELGIVSFADRGPGGNIEIDTRSLIVRDLGSIIASTDNAQPGGNLLITATDSVEVFGAENGFQSGLGTQAADSGQGGNLTINTPLLSIREGGIVSSATFLGTGRAGDLTVNADRVEVLDVQSDRELSFSLLRTETFGQGEAGNLNINAKIVNVRNGAAITTRSFGAAEGEFNSVGNAGQLTINASESISVEGESSAYPYITAQIISETTTQGNAGTITLNTPQLVIQGGGFISSEAQPGSEGKGGSLIVNASDFVQISGRAVQRNGLNERIQFSRLSSQTAGKGDAGDIQIQTPELHITNGGTISAASESAARGGDIQLQTTRLDIENGGRVTAFTNNAQGQAGQLIVNTAITNLKNRSSLSVEADNGGRAGGLNLQTQHLNLQAESQLNVSSPTGIAGSLEVTSDRITLNNSTLNAETGRDNPTGRGAEIVLQDVGILLLREGSRISASANDNAQGGNLNLSSQFIIAVPREDSDIRANAIRGKGGNVEIFSDRLFGIEPAERTLDISDITASSRLGAPGTVTLNTLDLDPSRGLAELPSDLIDATNQIDRSCSVEALSSGSGFVITGRGGIPVNPEEAETRWFSQTIAGGWLPLPDRLTSISGTSIPKIQNRTPNHSTSKQIAIQEASHWQSRPDGRVQLIGTTPGSNSHFSCTDS